MFHLILQNRATILRETTYHMNVAKLWTAALHKILLATIFTFSV